MSYKPKIKSTQFWDNLQPLQPWTHNCALFHWQVPSKSILDLAGNSSSNGSSRTTKAREGGSLPFKQQQQTPILWKMSLTQLRATLSGRSLKGVVLPRIRCLTNFITSRNYLSRSSVAKWSALLSVVLKLILVKSLGKLRWPCYKCARTLQELWEKKLCLWFKFSSSFVLINKQTNHDTSSHIRPLSWAWRSLWHTFLTYTITS